MDSFFFIFLIYLFIYYYYYFIIFFIYQVLYHQTSFQMPKFLGRDT